MGGLIRANCPSDSLSERG
uniref:Uncharacterized protein n=1 Tax=Anguilla anguilla TaxID=7936 RepID=A0A0E9U4F5_ANGAN